MTIYILGTPEETAQALDDKSLGKQIKNIAEVLCVAHQYTYSIDRLNSIPLKIESRNLNKSLDTWSQWARECRANYVYLADLGSACSNEEVYRQMSRYIETFKISKYRDAIDWGINNFPDLSGCDSHTGIATPFPLIPNKVYQKWLGNAFYCEYDDIKNFATELAYQDYYKEKIKKSIAKIDAIIGTSYKSPSNMNFEAEKPQWTKHEKPSWMNL